MSNMPQINDFPLHFLHGFPLGRRAALRSCFLLIVGASCVLPVAGCKTSAERTKERSETQNPLTDYVKTPQDRAKGAKAKVEAVQNGQAQQGKALSEDE